jgi:hypothetical protein
MYQLVMVDGVQKGEVACVAVGGGGSCSERGESMCLSAVVGGVLEEELADGDMIK